MKNLAAVAMIGFILEAVAPAYAVVTLVESRPLFEGALGAHELITFEEVPLGPVTPCIPINPFIPDPCIFTTQGITFTATQATGF